MTTKNFNLGDRVIINEKFKNRLWYTTKSFSIIDVEKHPILKIDQILPHAADIINAEYLVLLKEERKKKIKKLNED